MDASARFLPTVRDYSQPSTVARNIQQSHEPVDEHRETTFRIWRCSVPKKRDTHWHSDVELLYAKNGVCTVDCDSTHYELSDGAILLIPSGKLHNFVSQPQSEHYVFMFEMDDITRLKGFLTLMPLMLHPIHIPPASPIHESAKALLDQSICAHLSSDDSFAELENYARILMLYSLIGRIHFSSVKESVCSSSEKKQEHLAVIQNVMDYIDQHYMEELDLNRIAAQAGFSKYHFARLFKQYTNTTFHRFLCLKRIDMAERLMANGDRSIAKIALQVGFASIPTFNRVYKSVRNYTPSEYRALNHS